MMKRLLPSPLLTLALAAAWLILNRSLDPGNVILAVVFGVALPALLAPLRPSSTRVRHPWAIVRLIGVVAHDVALSNWMVLRTVVFGRGAPPHSRFVRVPLDLRDPAGITALAVITTTIPGTVWCELARDHSAFLLHVWDAPDEAQFAANYKKRYERPLMEIFES